jgi:hypothetical protein
MTCPASIAIGLLHARWLSSAWRIFFQEYYNDTWRHPLYIDISRWRAVNNEAAKFIVTRCMFVHRARAGMTCMVWLEKMHNLYGFMQLGG